MNSLNLLTFASYYRVLNQYCILYMQCIAKIFLNLLKTGSLKHTDE